jgi:hypothetical protein
METDNYKANKARRLRALREESRDSSPLQSKGVKKKSDSEIGGEAKVSAASVRSVHTGRFRRGRPRRQPLRLAARGPVLDRGHGRLPGRS